MAVAMAERAGLGPEGTRDLMRAALLHDIGKLGISNRILDKPGGFTGEEYGEIKRHPKITHDILSRAGPFRPIAETAANHHEKLDGSGYHRGIGAEDLDLPPHPRRRRHLRRPLRRPPLPQGPAPGEGP